MLGLDKKAMSEKFSISKEMYASVCNSCACGGGTASCNTTCKGCKDKNENIKEVKTIYSNNK